MTKIEGPVSAVMKNGNRKRLEIEETDFAYHVIESSSILLAPEEAVDPEYASGEKLHPAKEYAIDVYSRVDPLISRIYALNEIFGLLDIDGFPAKVGSCKFSRFEWLRLVVDLIHARFASIRDTAILVAATVMEVNLDPRRLRISSLEPIDRSKTIIPKLKTLASVGQKIRAARNLNFHQSELTLPTLDKSDLSLLSFAAKAETFGFREVKGSTATVMYNRTRKEILREYESDSKKMVAELKRLFKSLDSIYVDKLDLKFGRKPRRR